MQLDTEDMQGDIDVYNEQVEELNRNVMQDAKRKVVIEETGRKGRRSKRGGREGGGGNGWNDLESRSWRPHANLKMKCTLTWKKKIEVSAKDSLMPWRKWRQCNKFRSPPSDSLAGAGAHW